MAFTCSFGTVFLVVAGLGFVITFELCIFVFGVDGTNMISMGVFAYFDGKRRAWGWCFLFRYV